MVSAIATNDEVEQKEVVTEVAGRHRGSGHKSLLRSDALYQVPGHAYYCTRSNQKISSWSTRFNSESGDSKALVNPHYLLDTSVYPREVTVLKELRERTEKHSWNMMATPPDEGQFLMLLLKLINAKNTIEVGVYTGYSLLCTALALPPDGKVIALDLSREWFDIGAPIIRKAGVAHKIDFREGPAMDNIDALLRDENNHNFFDFIFVDADKDNYLNYHNRLIKLVKVGGVIGYDNTLWNGALVAGPDDPLPKYLRYYREYILELNHALAKDPRIQISQVPISDGITLCRRLS